ncbi:MAG: hypothetical protein GW802_17110 [Armatimonadetes bacterium]|nr:hypothetical protein [Armatimonadota bacterium]NCQ29125.1 hypothetical protein [Armatimonadota bacterium]
MTLEKYSLGIGDRFARQGKAQLRALLQAKALGANVVPVWNKSHREHTIIGTAPADVRAEADAAVAALAWTDAYYVDADHIGLKNVDLFLDASDFFTLDVADFTGQSASEHDIRGFVDRHRRYVGELSVPGIATGFAITAECVEVAARKYLLAVQEAGRIYRHVESAKGAGSFVAEVSMDETDQPQTPVELLFILSALAEEDLPAQTIAPKFTGRFNKGVDYVGDVAQFAKEFEEDVALLRFAIGEFGLPANLKLSVHSGSDKFSIYGAMNQAIRRHDAGLHLKTAGTTWLEELIGLALAGGDGLRIARDVYRSALDRFDELCGPYAAVIDIDPVGLPSPAEVAGWGGEEYAAALRHDQSCAAYNPSFRQLLHVGYKVAAELGVRYLDALAEFEGVIAANVTENILEQHVKPVFLG